MTELRPWIGRPPMAEPRDLPGFRLVRIELLSIVRVSLLGILLAPVWFVLFGVIVSTLGEQETVGGTISLSNVLFGFFALIGIVVVHEALHGAAIIASGQRPSFGAGPGFFYATCHEPLTWRSYAAVVVAPLVVINLVAIITAIVWPSLTGWALFVSLVNTMGAGGDIWMLVRIFRAPRDGRILDLASGFAIYRRVDGQATTASSTDARIA